eukprot:Protomagalhaensia_wolfi_Nauph_80__2833@NODE_293_length_2884_cov_230_880492_g134_i1_p3_GENE_NODE_293_length_2884_cov_230_880492_g134_i1NODE_293_length_2884_cov_230_880492_g134_i1_p3_ORF_typecomplete_len140_score19_33Ribosomal_L34e/PF01199_18/1_2e34Ribosomal_L34e/PF01199_18/1_3e03Cytochrom_CIII/PF02085_16/0_034Neur_chan_memb/PF02932_16/0_14_NODE_293_length_2884_cov_230_880492_g134_i124282847
MVVNSLHYRGRNTHNSPSNQVRIVKTPGNKLVYLNRKKNGNAPACGDCHHKLKGVTAVRPAVLHRIRKSRKTVSRAYGGNRCGNCVKKRVLRVFLYDEKRCFAAVLAEKQKQKATEAVKQAGAGGSTSTSRTKKTNKKH